MSDPGGILALEAVDGATVTLERFPIVVGRLVAGDPVPDVDVGHLDPRGRVAPAHCRLTPEGAGVLVHDLGAPGGTWVDGARVRAGHPRRLGLGLALRVADVDLRLVRFSEPDQAALLPESSAPGSLAMPVGAAAPARPGLEPPADPAQGGHRPNVPPPPSLSTAAGRTASGPARFAAPAPPPPLPAPPLPAPRR